MNDPRRFRSLPPPRAGRGITALLLALLPAACGAIPVPEHPDVVVYGGTSAGVIAAVQVARMGHTVVLIEPGTHLGGLSAGGLGMTDSGDKRTIGGLSREFYQRIKAHYSEDDAWRFEERDEFPFMRSDEDALWRFEPHVAESVFRAMLAEAQVPVVWGERLDLLRGVTKSGTRIDSIRMESGRTFTATVFLDATYEGDLMAKAGVTYTVGREGNAMYGETLAGVQTRRAVSHQFGPPVDPYVVPGDPESGLLPGVHPGPPGVEGAGDDRVQAYCFRMCTTDVAANQVPFPKPEGYDPQRYELGLRFLRAGGRRVLWNPSPVPNRKTDTNNNGPFSTDNIGMNYAYPDGDYATRKRIIEEHRRYQQGWLWFLAHDPRVPAEFAVKVRKYGLARDEFIDNDHWPHQLYVREARRMVSDYVNTELDCRRLRVTPDPVGLGSYNMDSHNVQRYVDAKGHVRNEGDIQVSPGGAYAISYRSLRPERTECINLLVPVCLSASHAAYGSIRMEPVFMVLGQSAATAAVLTVRNGIAVQDVDYIRLRERLEADGQVLTIPGKARRGLAASRFDGIVLDDDAATWTGEWVASTSTPPFVGAGYRHDGDAGKGNKRARFAPRLPRPGRYTVSVAFSPHDNRATKVPVRVRHAGGIATVFVDQRRAPDHPPFATVGTYSFPADGTAAVEITNEGTTGYVIVDAVRFAPVRNGEAPK